jgi:hypothetical protein
MLTTDFHLTQHNLSWYADTFHPTSSHSFYSDDYTSALKNGQLKFHVDSIDYQAQQSDLFESHFLFSMSQDLLELWLIQNDRSELVTELGVALED